jgi:hypothetical protein
MKECDQTGYGPTQTTNLQHHLILHSNIASPHDEREKDELHENEASKIATGKSVNRSTEQDVTKRIEKFRLIPQSLH